MDSEFDPAADLRPIGDATLQPNSPVVSVIVPHFNDLENLRRCLQTLSQQSLERSRYEIIVCDNNSSCGLAAVVEACGGIAKVVSAPKQGAGEARNVGAAAARGAILAFTDSDCRPAREWLQRGVGALETTDIVGGRIIVSVGDRRHLTPAEAYELVFAFNNRRYVEREGYSVTANMFTRRDVFDRVGAFRVGVSEDLDWGQRAAARGFRMRYEIDVVVAHPARRDWSDLIRKWRRLTAESFALACEQPYGKLRWFGRSWLILLSPFVHFLAILQSADLVSLNSRINALSTLVRLRVWRFVECNRRLLYG